jgi:hypothetical protein
MSLKAFHFFFIIVSIVLGAGLSFWAFSTGASVGLGWGSGAVSLFLAVYFVSFLRKARSIIT